MAARHQAPQLIIDKRQTDAGTEYLVSTTNEWISSSTSRVIHPELVELYEWLHNSGFRSGATVFAPSALHVATAKGARKRVQSSSGPLPVSRRQSETQVDGSGDGQANPDDEARVAETEADVSDQESAFQDNLAMPKLKKQRLEGSCIEEMNHLAIKNSESAASTNSAPTPTNAIQEMSLEDKQLTVPGSEANLESDEPQVMAFNKNTEHMIEVYFKEGMGSSVDADSSSGTGSGMGATGMGTRLNGIGRHNGDFADMSLQHPTSSLSGRLPSWNSIWDLIKAQFGLDTRPESKQHIALQEHHIRKRLESDEQPSSPPSARGKFKPRSNADSEDEIEETNTVKEEQEIREGIGRLIVGLLLRLQPYTSAQSIQQALNVAFQIVGLAFTSRYLESPSQPLSGPSTSINGTARGASTTTGPIAAGVPRSTTSWPLNERFKLNAEGAEIMQLGQQLLLLLIRFTGAGQLFTGKGMEELVREVEGRLTKVNRDQKLKPSVPFLQERRSLDQTEIFLKMLIQGPSLLDPGTGSGAGERLRKENADHTDEHLDAFGSALGGDCAGVLKSQTGISMGSSVFVMNMVDYWFRTRTTSSQSGGFNGLLSFHRVLTDYARPSHLRPASSLTDSASITSARKTKKATKTQPKRSTRSQKSPDSEADEADEEDIALDLTSVTISAASASSSDEAEQWNAKDLRELEWVVMMLEVLIWSWIEARGIRKEDIKGTGLDQVLFPDDIASQQSQNSSQGAGSGWQEMSILLSKVGGTLKTRWEVLEASIEAAIMMEELGLR
ncbi:hypothetical protein EC968_005325 [Mortierella alpina]|nr:hypothetical protein EC968_005325 [Mortierella alpina]